MNDLRIDSFPQPLPVKIQDNIPFVPPPVSPVVDPILPNPIPLPTDEPDVPVSDEPKTDGSVRSYLRELWKKVVVLLGVDATEQEEQLAEVKKEQQLQVIGIRPLLEKPKIDSRTHVHELMAAIKKADDELLVKRVDFTNDPVEVEQPKKRQAADQLEELAPPPKRTNFASTTLDESALEKQTIEVNKMMLDNRTKETANMSDTILHEGEEKKRLWKQYLDLKAEAELKAKQSKILSWTSIGIGIISGALLVAGIIGAIFTAGASLGAAIAIAGGVAGISGGSTGITGSVMKYKGNLISGEAFVMKEQQGLKKEIITNTIQNMESNDNSITQLWANLAQLLRNMPTDMMRQ